MTIGDVAAVLGVSKGTVSRAITGNGRIAPATRQRVLDYMAANDFHPNTIAQSLSCHRTMSLAFTVPSDRELMMMPFFLQALAGAIGEASARGYDILVVGNTTTDVRRVVSQQKVDGVIVSRNLVGSHMLGYLGKAGVPFVLIGTTDHPGVAQIDHDHRAACRELATRLRELWPGSPGMIAGSRSHLVTHARVNGFTDVFPAAPVVWDALDRASVAQAFATLRDAGVTDVYCEDDAICYHLESSLRNGELGVDAGAVNVACFVDSPLLDIVDPGVPTVHFHTFELGARACSMVIAQIAGELPGNVTLDYRIVISGHPALTEEPKDGPAKAAWN